jgi:hypothetical protein
VRGLVAVALLILSVYTAISLWNLRSTTRRYRQAQQDQQEVSELLRQIQRFRQTPKVAALQLESPAEITNRIARALQAAGLSESSLMKEEPSDPQRLQQTDFEVRSTVIELAPAGLPQILRFCEALRDPETGTMVRDLVLSPPRDQENDRGQERWKSQMVLTQMIFSPKSK